MISRPWSVCHKTKQNMMRLCVKPGHAPYQSRMWLFTFRLCSSLYHKIAKHLLWPFIYSKTKNIFRSFLLSIFCEWILHVLHAPFLVSAYQMGSWVVLASALSWTLTELASDLPGVFSKDLLTLLGLGSQGMDIPRFAPPWGYYCGTLYIFNKHLLEPPPTFTSVQTYVNVQVWCVWQVCICTYMCLRVILSMFGSV